MIHIFIASGGQEDILINIDLIIVKIWRRLNNKSTNVGLPGFKLLYGLWSPAC